MAWDKYPKRIRADVERGFIIAYYELVRGLRVSLSEEGRVDDVVATASSAGQLIGMDFSSIYHFTEEQKPQTRLRRLRKKVEYLKRISELLLEPHENPWEVLYEIWCFIDPNEYVLQTAETAKQEGLPVEVVNPEELNNRIRQTAEIELADKDMVSANAFLWSAELFRMAGAWRK
jgi:hypothetical protein